MIECNVETNTAVITELYQYDYGQKIIFTGSEIQDGTEIHFFQGEYGCKGTIINQVADIPDYLLSHDKTVLAYLYLTNIELGKTIKKITILIMPREKPPDYVDPTKPADYSRLLPIGGEIGDLLIVTEDGYAWKDLDGEFASAEQLQKVSESIPMPMTVQDILEICRM